MTNIEAADKAVLAASYVADALRRTKQGRAAISCLKESASLARSVGTSARRARAAAERASDARCEVSQAAHDIVDDAETDAVVIAAIAAKQAEGLAWSEYTRLLDRA
jgi:hypothetical protein